MEDLLEGLGLANVRLHRNQKYVKLIITMSCVGSIERLNQHSEKHDGLLVGAGRQTNPLSRAIRFTGPPD
jgi:hypothetical protein